MSHNAETDHDWGEKTKQNHKVYPNPTAEEKPDGWNNMHEDHDEIRRKFGFPAFSHEWDEKEYPYPNCIHHHPDGDRYGHPGGTNALIVGEKGSGKSSLGRFMGERLMEVNNEAVVWRGQNTASEWLPYRDWTTLILPANADIDARWKPQDIRKSSRGEPAVLSNVVREVKYYEDLRDLNEKIEPGKFHVVYPDPSFTGCEEAMRESDFCPTPVSYTPTHEDDATPLVHWWFAWFVAKLEYGPWDWTSIIFDEAADLAPDGASADAHDTYTKIKALRRVMAQSRKYYFSLFFYCHHEENLHSKIRRTIQWRVNMPDGTANPCQGNNDRPPVGFRQIPMRADMMSRQPIGRCLWWTETNFTRVKWPDTPFKPQDRERWLKIKPRPLGTGPTTSSSAAAGGAL